MFTTLSNYKIFIIFLWMRDDFFIEFYTKNFFVNISNFTRKTFYNFFQRMLALRPSLLERMNDYLENTINCFIIIKIYIYSSKNLLCFTFFQIITHVILLNYMLHEIQKLFLRNYIYFGCVMTYNDTVLTLVHLVPLRTCVSFS